MMSFANALLLRISIIIAITDLVVYYAVQKKHIQVTLPFVIAVIIITIVPIIINIWFAFQKYGMKW